MDPAIAKAYRLTEPNPVVWTDPVDEDQQQHRKNTRRATTRYSILQEEGRSSRAVGGAFDSGIPSDEPDPLGATDSVVRVLRQKGVPVDENLPLRNKYLVSSKTFSPALFLRDVHGKDTQPQLVAGLEFLSRSIDQKSQSLKILVENNFDRFVAAKATIEGVYREMKERNLSKEKEWGTQDIRMPLSDAARKVQEIYGPAMDGRGREDRYRVMLDVIEKHKAKLEMPATLAEHIRRREYDSILEEYQKARKWVEEARALIPSNPVGVKEANIHQLLISEKMWTEVGRSIDDFKRETWRRLVDTKQDDNFMELIGILLELGVEDNPIWVWLLSRYDYLKNKINKVFERTRIEIEVARRKVAAMPPPSDYTIAFYLRSPQRRLPTEKLPPLDTPQNIELWDMIYTTLSNILSPTNGIVSEIVTFWETAENFIQGKAQVTLPVGLDDQSRRHHRLSSDGVRDLQSGGKELVSLLRDRIGAFFTEPPVEDISAVFSPIPATPDSTAAPTPTSAKATTPGGLDIPGAPKRKDSDNGEDFAFLPPHANSLGGLFYLVKILTLVGNAASTLSALEIGRPGSEKMKGMIAVARERCVQAMCFTWQRDTQNCKLLEDWTRTAESKDRTRWPEAFFGVQNSIISGVQKLVYLSEVKPIGGVEVVQPPSAKLLQNVRIQFVRSLYKALQGMVENAKRPPGIKDWDEENSDLATPARALSARFVTVHAVDYTDRDVRLLLTLSNLEHLKKETAPSLVSQYETAFSVKLTDESKTVRDAITQIDAQLFDEYTKPRVKHLQTLARTGLLSSTWGTLPRPTDAAPYVYTSLLTLVLVHSQVSTTAPSLKAPLLSYLLESLKKEILETLKQFPSFNISQLLQATVDLEFISQTMEGYTTKRCTELHNSIYAELDRASDKEAKAELQKSLVELKGILSLLRKRSKAEFLCLRAKKAPQSSAASSGFMKIIMGSVRAFT